MEIHYSKVLIQYRRWVYYLKGDCNNLNVHTVNPKVAIIITKSITKKPTKEIENGIIKNTQSKRRQRGLPWWRSG